MNMNALVTAVSELNFIQFYTMKNIPSKQFCEMNTAEDRHRCNSDNGHDCKLSQDNGY